MIYLETIGRKDNITDIEKITLDKLTDVIKNVINNLSERSENNTTKEELLQYVIENTEIN